MANVPISTSWSKLVTKDQESKNFPMYRKLQRISGNGFRLLIKDWLDDYGDILLNEFVDNTPIVTGNLRKHWHRSKVKGIAPKYRVEITNDARNKAVYNNGASVADGWFDNLYLPFVEYGHRGVIKYLENTGEGSGVIVYGVKEGYFTHGTFFMKNSFERIVPVARKDYSNRVRLYLRSIGFEERK